MAKALPTDPASEAPLVSVIIPLYNCLPLTKACLASLVATMPSSLSYEVILVDDGSTDGTREWLQSLDLPQVRILLNDTNLGYARSNNLASRIARGSILALLNNDLILARRWIEPMLHALTRLGSGIVGNVQYRAATGELDHVGIRINAKGKPEHVRDADGFLPRVLPVAAVTGACFIIPKNLWDAVGGFDEDFVNGGEDVDLCFKVSAAGHPVVVATRSKVQHHVSPSPNRKRRDEENAYRLTTKWRSTLAELGVRAWVAQRLERDLVSTVARSPAEALRLALYHVRLVRAAPLAAQEGIEAAIALEITRWQQMLGTGATH